VCQWNIDCQGGVVLAVVLLFAEASIHGRCLRISTWGASGFHPSRRRHPTYTHHTHTNTRTHTTYTLATKWNPTRASCQHTMHGGLSANNMAEGWCLQFMNQTAGQDYK
jgi:hypothetical protein